MRSSFEKNLRRFNKEAAHSASSPDSDIDNKEGNPEINRLNKLFQDIADESGTTAQAQEYIYDLQVQKRSIMDRLHQSLRCLDDPDCREEKPEGSYLVIERDGDLLWQPDPATHPALPKEVKITPGDILTDAKWGIVYHLDPNSIPRHFRKRYAMERAKDELRELLDEQIITYEIDNTNNVEGIKHSYEAIVDDKASGKRENNRGLLAERMVETFMRRLLVNNPDIGIELAHADVYDDVYYKVDFLLKNRINHHRGVKTEENNKKSARAIQFTTIDPIKSYNLLASKKKIFERGRSRLENEKNLKDIVLVAIPLKKTKMLYNQWKSSRMPGGPAQLWPESVQQDIIEGILKNMLSEEENSALLKSA